MVPALSVIPAKAGIQSALKSLFPLFCVLLGACGTSSHPGSAHPSAVETRLPKLELPLARKNEFYAVFDLARRSVQFKMRGAVLRDLRIIDLKIHRPWPARATLETLVEKGIAREPARTVIEPLKNPDDADTESVVVERVEDSYELEDMPAFFTVEFEESKILVLSRSTRPLGFLERLPAAAARAVFFFKRLAAPRSPAATLVLTPGDARALYWAFSVHQKALIASH